MTTTRSGTTRAAAMLTALLLAGSLSGCDRDEGPLEEAAESMDEATTDFGNAVEDACEDMKEDMNARDSDC